MLLEHLIIKATLNPKKIFLIDGLGAILSALLLGVVLVEFEALLGIPTSVLYSLAIIPLFFAIYDFYAYRKANQKIGLLLNGIAVMNLGYYCFLSLGLALYHFETVTSLGWRYIIIEVLVILLLTMIECRVGKKMTKK